MHESLLILLLFLLVPLTQLFAQDAPVPGYAALEDCFIEIDASIDHDCGYVAVPDVYTGESQRTLQLGIVRLKADSATPGTPLFMLMGGPSQSIATFLDTLPVYIMSERASSNSTPTFSRILENHDIVLMEQRGSNFTDTPLTCPEIGSLAYDAFEQQLDVGATQDLFVDTLNACIARLNEAGIDLNVYNSVNNAADVNSVAQALGYDQIIYYGESYGAQLGQFVMRDYPDLLEAVILDGANPLSKTSWVQDRAASFQTALDNVVALCAERPACVEQYGDLGAVIDAAIAQFDNGPVQYTFENEGVTIELDLTLDDFASTVNSTFGFVGNFLLPLTFKQISEGNFEAIGLPRAVSILGSQGATASSAILMQYSIICSDDPTFAVNEADAEGVSSLAIAAGRAEAASIVIGCQLVEVQQLPDTSDVDVSIDVPILLLSGGLDTRTPTARNQEVADHLPNSRLVVFPTGAHVQVPNIPCANAILAEFVVDPSALQSIDTSCIAAVDSDFQFAAPE